MTIYCVNQQLYIKIKINKKGVDRTILPEGEKKAAKQCKRLNKPSYYSFTVAIAHWRFLYVEILNVVREFTI